MKYFLHDCNAFNDEKISELFLHYGYEGLGLFYSVLEKIGAQEKPIKTVVLKHQLQVGKKLEKCWLFMEQIGLISTQNGDTFNERILSYSETYQIKKEKNRERISEWREKQAVEKNVTHTERVSNASKVKVSKVNKVNNRANALVVADATTVAEERKKYDQLLEELQGKETKDVYLSIENFVLENKPSFPDPYVDAWNLVAAKYGLEKVGEITDDRKDKIRTRTREPGFDFFKAIKSITKNSFYRGENNNGWKVTFNYVINSQKNYTTMIEKLGT